MTYKYAYPEPEDGIDALNSLKARPEKAHKSAASRNEKITREPAVTGGSRNVRMTI